MPRRALREGVESPDHAACINLAHPPCGPLHTRPTHTHTGVFISLDPNFHVTTLSDFQGKVVRSPPHTPAGQVGAARQTHACHKCLPTQGLRTSSTLLTDPPSALNVRPHRSW